MGLERNAFYQMDAVSLSKELADESVSMFLSDPPYGTGKEQKLLSSGESYHDVAPDQVVRWCTDIASEALRFLKPEGLFALCLDDRASHEVAVSLKTLLHFHGEIIWHFETGGLSKSWYSRKHNTVLMFGLSAKRPKFDFDQVPTVERKAPKPGYFSPKKLNSVWNINVSTTAQERTSYVNQKPEELFERFVKVHTDPGDLIVDPFCGSGTTAMVAERNGRDWICGDTNPAALTIANERLESYMMNKGAIS